jgi:hypothetical protein
MMEESCRMVRWWTSISCASPGLCASVVLIVQYKFCRVTIVLNASNLNGRCWGGSGLYDLHRLRATWLDSQVCYHVSTRGGLMHGRGGISIVRFSLSWQV